MAGAKNRAAPIPSINLVAKSDGKFAESPSPIPDSDKIRIPICEVFFGPQREDRIPAGIWKIPAPSKNEEVRKPMVGWSIPRSIAMSGNAGEMLNQLTV